jgi:DNA-binding transcriptional LysR family regulator
LATRPPSILALQDMALFVEVARAGSFTGAAKASGVPIATLSRRIAALEKRVGVRLFERTTRRLAVTEPGRRYLERCEVIVQEAGLAHEALMDTARRPAGRLRLSMPVEFGLSLIAPIVDEFARRYPEIAFDLDLSSRPAALADQKVDVSIRLGEITDPSLVVAAWVARRGCSMPRRPTWRGVALPGSRRTWARTSASYNPTWRGRSSGG